MSRIFFVCLKQDLQDEQDEEAITRCKGLEDLNVYRTSAQPGEKVREALNRYRLKQDGQDYQDGQDEEAIAGAREAMQENLPRVGIGVTAPALEKKRAPAP